MSAARLSWAIETNGISPPQGVMELWYADPQSNPFTAPRFLHAMHVAARSRGERPVWAIGRTATGATLATWAMRLDKSRTLRFLPLAYSDQSTCTAAEDVDVSELADGLVALLRAARPNGIELTGIPPWSRTQDAASAALQQLGWRHRAFAAWSCPVLRVASGPDSGSRLAEEIDRHKRVRGYANALRREPEFAFEVLESDDDLSPWLREFCDAHERRWSNTATPSIYASADARALLRDAVQAWLEDGVLVRFAVRTASGRVAQVIALRAGTRLVYFHVVNSPEGERSRAGHVLIRLIGLWMSERGYDTLDFGAGGEEYKARYANGDDRLSRVYGGPHMFSRTFARAIVESRIRESPTLMRGWTALRRIAEPMSAGARAR